MEYRKMKFGYGHLLVKEENNKKVFNRLLSGGKFRFGDGHFLKSSDLEELKISSVTFAKTKKNKKTK